jgi:hypothetical protein
MNEFKPVSGGKPRGRIGLFTDDRSVQFGNHACGIQFPAPQQVVKRKTVVDRFGFPIDHHTHRYPKNTLRTGGCAAMKKARFRDESRPA